MKSLIMVGLGSSLGGVLRYAVSYIMRDVYDGAWPWGTFMVNILGCLLMGMVMGWVQKNTVAPAFILLLTSGFLGGFTTFSAFSNEAVTLFKSGAVATASAYVALSVTLGLAATALGYALLK